MDASMTMYDYAKQVVANEVPMDPVVFNCRIDEVAKAMISKNYWMLLCIERRDYTVFNTTDCVGDFDAHFIAEELKPTLMNRGLVLLIDEQKKDEVYEIWIRDPETNENFVYYLFNYEEGVIVCNG